MASPRKDLIWSSSNGVQDQYLELFEKGRLSDAEVRCGKRIWKVHKAILCVKSKWFTKALTGPFKEAETCVINITEFEEKEVDCLLRYIYTGKINVTKTFSNQAALTAAVTVWKMGDFFCLEDLRKVAIEGFNELSRQLTFMLSVMKITDSLALGQVRNIVQQVQTLYKERSAIQELVKSRLLAILLSGIHLFAKTQEFQTLLCELPEFASDWAVALTNSVGSLSMPQSIPGLCDRCNGRLPLGFDRVLWFKQRRLEVFCENCFPDQCLENWIGEAIKPGKTDESSEDWDNSDDEEML